ncbi:hypothetical protein C2S51_023652 [Perilla frutescens var. frutescens]|nr:hypothetical protein C2S51_023652 [Perilla frutescens var. frutescens]
MASISPILSLHLVFSLLLFTHPVLSDHAPAHSPSLPPHPPADGISPPPATPSSAPSPAPSFSSPPAPPPSDLAPKPHSPAPTPDGADDKSPSPSPAPEADAGDINRETQPNAADLESKEKSSGGMSSGQKAGVAIGVIAGACIVGAGALVYRKRQQNIQRTQFGSAARREIL